MNDRDVADLVMVEAGHLLNHFIEVRGIDKELSMAVIAVTLHAIWHGYPDGEKRFNEFLEDARESYVRAIKAGIKP